MKSKLITISVNETYIARLNSICVKIGIGKSEAVRRAIDLLFKKEMSGEPSGPAPSRVAKSQREEAFDAFKKMSPAEMTEELIKIGYIVVGERHSISGGEIFQRVELTSGGLLFVTEMGPYNKDNLPVSRSTTPVENLYGDIQKFYKKLYQPK